MTSNLLKYLLYTCCSIGAAWLCAELAFNIFQAPVLETMPVRPNASPIPVQQNTKNSQSYETVLKRNLFHVPVEAGAPYNPMTPDQSARSAAEEALLAAELDQLPVSKQGWTLLGTVVNTLNPRENRAILVVDNKQAAHRTGNEIKGWKLIHINRRCVVVERNGRRERLLVGGKELSLPASRPQAARGNLNGRDIEQALKDIPALLTQAGFEPGQHNGRMGLNLTFVKPDSIFARLGLKTNDLLLQANGQSLTNLGDLARLANITREDSLHVELLRNGENVVLEYDIKR